MNEEIDKKEIRALCSKLVCGDDQHSEQGYRTIKKCIENNLHLFVEISEFIAELCESKDILTNVTGNLAAGQLSKFVLRYLEEDYEDYQKTQIDNGDEE